MTPPDEVVCESEGRFIYEVRKHVDYHPGGKVMPGDSVTVGDKRIVYRPPAPKPAPPIGCLRDEHIDALKRDGRFVLNGETILYEATPRDEAREAFEKWWDLGAIGISTISQKEGCHRAFLAGRASVKP